MDIALLVHVTTSVATLLISSYAWYKPSLTVDSNLNKYSLISIITGVMVSLGQPLTLIYCAKLGLYLSTIVATKYMLYLKAKGQFYDQNRG